MKTFMNLIATVQGTKAILMILILLGLVSSCSKTDDDMVEPINNSPDVVLTAQADGSTITGTLNATDSDGTISSKKVDIKHVDGTVIASIIVPVNQNTFSSTNLADQLYIVEAIVVDNDGAEGTDSTSVTIDTTVPETFLYELTENVTATAENVSSTSLGIISSLNQTGTASFDTASLTVGASQFTLTGNDVTMQSSVVLDYETAITAPYMIAYQITLQKSGFANIVLDGGVEITDQTELVSTDKLCGGHGVNITETLDVADNDPTTQNLIVYALDSDGNNIGTMAATKIDVEDTTWSYGGANLAAVASNLATTPLLDDEFGNDRLIVTTGASGGMTRVSDGETLSGDSFAFGLMYMQEKLEASGYTFIDDESWAGAHFATNPDDAIYRLASIYYAENISKETDGQTLDELNEEMLLDALNKVMGLTPTEAYDILADYLAGNQAGGQLCD